MNQDEILQDLRQYGQSTARDIRDRNPNANNKIYEQLNMLHRYGYVEKIVRKGSFIQWRVTE